jgi:membrane protein YqaA with SNARE-associated domain
MDFFETHLWQWFSKRGVAVIAMCLMATVGGLVLRYWRAKGWDREWKDRWEQRHEKSLEVLLRTKRRNLKYLMLFRWMTIAVFFMGLGASFGPVYGMASGLHRLPRLVVEAMIVMNLTFLIGLLTGIAVIRVARFEIGRLEELL